VRRIAHSGRVSVLSDSIGQRVDVLRTRATSASTVSIQPAACGPRGQPREKERCSECAAARRREREREREKLSERERERMRQKERTRENEPQFNIISHLAPADFVPIKFAHCSLLLWRLPTSKTEMHSPL
jgi:hypothetical protein